MHSVSVILRESLFAQLNIVCIITCACKVAVSWAYIFGSQFDSQFGRSLMYNRNSSDPKIVPWGTPQLNEQLLESDPLMEHI